jgi:hypothetical protein
VQKLYKFVFINTPLVKNLVRRNFTLFAFPCDNVNGEAEKPRRHRYIYHDRNIIPISYGLVFHGFTSLSESRSELTECRATRLANYKIIKGATYYEKKMNQGITYIVNLRGGYESIFNKLPSKSALA